MTLIMRHRWTWSNIPGQPGYTTFYALGTSAQAFVDGIGAFLTGAITTGASGGLPNGVNVAPDSFVDIINDVDGVLDQSQTITPPATLNGANSGTYAAPAGACITWITGGIVNGRRVRGRTFLVPLSSNCFQADGTLDTTKRTAMQTAANTYLAGSWNAAVWHRPVNGAGGIAFDIGQASVRDKVAILTSRRD